MNIVPRLRNKKMVPWLLAEFIWRRKHYGDLWGGVMTCLSEVAFRRNSELDPVLTQFTSELTSDSEESESEIESTEEEVSSEASSDSSDDDYLE